MEYSEFEFTPEQKEGMAAIRADMFQQLEASDVHGMHYEDMLDDYMRLCELKLQLLDDIQQRGVVCKYNNGGGQSGWKRNDSVQEFLKVNMQMLKILDALKLKPSQMEQKVIDKNAPVEI